MKLEILRYVVTGALSVLLNTSLIVALTELAGFHYLVSTGACFLLVTGVSFAMNRAWTFRSRDNAARQLTRYTLVVAANLLASLGLSFALVEAGVPYPLASVVLSILFVPASFLVHRRWSFSLPWTEHR